MERIALSDRSKFILKMILFSTAGAVAFPVFYGVGLDIVLVAGFIGAAFGGFLSRLFKDDFNNE